MGWIEDSRGQGGRCADLYDLGAMVHNTCPHLADAKQELET